METKRRKTSILYVVLHDREIFLHTLKQAYVLRIERGEKHIGKSGRK
jgi:hypothetical protein